MNDFKAYMKMARLRAGFASQQAAADAIGCERGTVGMWEAPSSAVEKLSGEFLFPVAKAYRVRPEYLSGDSDDEGYPWRPDAPDPAASQPRRYDLEILASAIENVGRVGEISGEELFAEYARLAANVPVDSAARRKSIGNHESQQRRSAGAGKDSERTGRRRKK
jgi:hypothetical protein